MWMLLTESIIIGIITFVIGTFIFNLSIDKNKPKYWEDFNYQLKYRIIYSFAVYAICAFGFFTMFNDNLYKRYLSILIIFISIFYIAFLGWVGTPRYMVPILIFLSIFFGVGLIKLLKLSNLIK
jgi:hypothetical protein